MASIIAFERFENHAVLSIKLDRAELAELKGSMDNIHLIPEENARTKSNVYERGKKGNTKYFLIPKSLRNGVELKKEAYCLRLNSKDKVVWSYIMNK